MNKRKKNLPQRLRSHLDTFHYPSNVWWESQGTATPRPLAELLCVSLRDRLRRVQTLCETQFGADQWQRLKSGTLMYRSDLITISTKLGNVMGSFMNYWNGRYHWHDCRAIANYHVGVVSKFNEAYPRVLTEN